MFGTVLILLTTFMHIYVFCRIASIPRVRKLVSRKMLFAVGAGLWTVFYLGRVIGHHGTGMTAMTLEFLGMNWMASLFLIFLLLLFTDLTTLFGLLVPGLSSSLRLGAVTAGVALSVIALLQGLRAPVIREYEVHLAGLPTDMDGTVLVAVSDMHLGSMLGAGWLKSRTAQIMELRPDIIVLLGDIFEGHSPPADELITAFRELSAPLGIWAVTGNHEFYGRDRTGLFAAADFSLLSNSWTEIRPGFILAGLDDLTAWHRNGRKGDLIGRALTGRPAGATILLSHSPWYPERIAAAGVGLMLSGHTHGGQIWPFDYLVRQRYPLLEGRYEVDGTTVIVSRGTGTWGPRMRLWHPGEILRVTLRGA